MKKIFLVILIILGIFLPNKVYALEDSIAEKEYIPGAYIKKLKNGSGKYEQMKVFRRNSDNRPVYCIEIWEKLSNNKIIPGYDYGQNSYANIEYGVWERIMLISYYGYGYQNHTNLDWYAATQFMIWKETSSSNTTIYFTDTLNGNKIDKYVNEMNEIENLIRNHANVPSFYNETYDVLYNQEYTITDTNNVLDYYDVTGTGAANVNKSENNLTFKTTRNGNFPIIFTKRDKIYSSNPIVYIDDDGQNILAAGSYYPIYMVINLNLPSTDITINKLDYDTNSNISIPQGNLIQSKFELLDLDNNVVAESEIIDNKIVFKDIGYGNYKLREISAGMGYLLNNQIININVNSENNTFDFYNNEIKNKVIINKYLKNSLTNKVSVEENAKFMIKDINDNEVLTFETNNNGTKEIILPYGKYIITQISGKKNYQLVDDFEIEIKEDGKVQVFDLYNEIKKTKLKINNLDKDSNLPILEEVSFTLKNIDTQEEIEIKTDKTGITNEIEIASGKYELISNTKIMGYLKNVDKKILEINEENYDFKEELLIIDFLNEKEKTQIELNNKIEYYLDDNLINTEINNDINVDIYAKEDIYSKDGNKLYEKDSIVETVSYKDNKLISNSLIFGDYYIKDINTNNQIDINISNTDLIKIEFLDKVYEYTQKGAEEEIIIDNVPNTYKEKIDNKNIYLFISLIGLLIVIFGEKKYEND